MGFCIMDIYILSLVNHMPNWKKIILTHLQHPASAKKIHHIVTIIQSTIYNPEHSVASSIPEERNLSLIYHGGEQTQHTFDVSFAFTPSNIRRQQVILDTILDTFNTGLEQRACLKTNPHA